MNKLSTKTTAIIFAKSFSIALFWSVFIYLSIGFVKWDFMPSNWNAGDRWLMVSLGFFISVVLFASVFACLTDHEKNERQYIARAKTN